MGGDQRCHGRGVGGPPPGHRLRLRALPRHGRGGRGRDPRRRRRDPGVRGGRSRRAALARRGRRGGGGADRPLPRPGRGCQAPRRGRASGGRVRPGQGTGRHGGAGRELRGDIRPRGAPHHLQRLLHHELPRTRRQGPPPGLRGPPRRDDHRARVHRRPGAPRRASQGPPAGPGGRAQPRARREGGRPRRARARRAPAGLRRARADADRLTRRSHRGARVTDLRGRGQRRGARSPPNWNSCTMPVTTPTANETSSSLPQKRVIRR